MMFITPMPPSASVIRLTQRKKLSMAPIILRKKMDSRAVFQVESASVSRGSNPFRGARISGPRAPRAVGAEHELDEPVAVSNMCSR